MVAMQRALGSVFGTVGGDIKGDVISREKQHQCTSADTMSRWGKFAKSGGHKDWKMIQLCHAGEQKNKVNGTNAVSVLGRQQRGA